MKHKRKAPANYPRRGKYGPLPVIRIGKFALGLVNEVNGPGSVTEKVPLSKFEAVLLVQYWASEYEACDYFRNIQYSSKDERIFDHARERILELRDAGLITQEQITQIVDKVYDEHDKRWKELRKTQDAWRQLAKEETADVEPDTSEPEIGC